MHLIFKEIFLINLFFNLLYIWTLFLKIKKLFLNNISNMWALNIIFFLFILFIQFNMYVYFYYHE